MPELSKEYPFNRTTGLELDDYKYGKEWPAVYMIFNSEEAYIGETVDVRTRLAQHWMAPERRKLERVRIISDDTFNKSVVLDLEAFLISHMQADSRFRTLQNGNAGHQKHNYYQKEYYEKQFEEIWEGLRRYGLAVQEIKKIENSNVFKYSPYKSLTPDQYSITMTILDSLIRDLRIKKKRSFIVNGGPGTGKTILGIYLMKLLTTPLEEDLGSDDEKLIENLHTIKQLLPNMKIGIVVSMENLRKTLKDIFKSTYGLNSSMVYGPSEIANSHERFDLLIVDEAHRLKATRAVGTEIGSMQKANIKLGFGKNTGTQLDWILKKSDYQIFFYDELQSIRKADIDAFRFDELQKSGARSFTLTSQIRCKEGGDEYIKYIRDIFSDHRPEKKKTFGKYELKLFTDVRKMTDKIKAMDNNPDISLCRNVAGYAWPWNTHDKISPQNEKDTEYYINNGLYDIEIDGNKYIWNVTRKSWISMPNSINEIGCVHTIQGFDLNYAGVIIGKDLRYDEKLDKLYINKDSYYDKKVLTDDEALKQYIYNIYAVLCTRGINGTYIYACDEGLRNYLKKFIEVAE